MVNFERSGFDVVTAGNGTLDLRTGQLRPFSPDDLITRATDVNYSPTAQCPRWLKFLDEIFGGDEPLIDFIRVQQATP